MYSISALSPAMRFSSASATPKNSTQLAAQPPLGEERIGIMFERAKGARISPGIYSGYEVPFMSDYFKEDRAPFHIRLYALETLKILADAWTPGAAHAIEELQPQIDTFLKESIQAFCINPNNFLLQDELNFMMSIASGPSLVKELLTDLRNSELIQSRPSTLQMVSEALEKVS